MSITTIALAAWAALFPAETLTLPVDQRPAWLREKGIVMAGNWEPLPFRAQRDCAPDALPSPEQRAGYAREHSPQMVERLRVMGVTFVMAHAYKGLGFLAEQESMLDAVRFAQLCHQAGLHVGVYCNSGTISWALMFAERFDSTGWLTLNPRGLPIMYGYAPYRYRWDRQHPDAAAFHREIVRFCVESIRADMLHFDNYNVGPGIEATAQRGFREFLNARFTPAEREQMGAAGDQPVPLPIARDADPILHRAWVVYASQSLADTYYDLTRFARKLRKDVLLELNPGGPGERIRPPVDHGRMLGGGEAFWDEGQHPHFQDGELRTRIRTYKVARAMDNIAFAYVINPLEAAESMAFNNDCLGSICWFEYADVVSMPGSNDPVSPELAPYVRFYRQRRDLFNQGTPVADVAILRSFASQVFADPAKPALTASVEQALIEKRVPFQIIYDQQLDRLDRYKVLVLAGCVALSDAQLARIRQFTAAGGALVLVGPAATHDEWLRPRAAPALDDLKAQAIVRIAAEDDVVATLHAELADRLSARIDAPHGVCAELIRQENRDLVHLVNYTAQPARNIIVRLRVPHGARAAAVRLISPARNQERPLALESSGGHVSFTVPRCRTYAIACVEWQRAGR